jgi:hypothetical protein
LVSKRLEDRINHLMAKAIATTDPDELERVISELREALSEHIQKVGKWQLQSCRGRESAKPTTCPRIF